MRWRSQLILGSLICFLILQASSYLPPSQDQETLMVEQLLKQKESAVRERDSARFLALIDPDNRFYIQEQKRWFADAIKVMEPGSYSLTLLYVKSRQKDRLQVVVKQSYRQNGKSYVLQMPLVIRKTKKGWKESDLPFFKLKSDQVQVLYTTPSLEESAYIALDTIKRALYVMKHHHQWQAKKVEVKLYHDSELFRQSVKPSLPAWSGGWNEAGQAIKMVVNRHHPKLFASGLVHELVHQMVSDLTNDNAAYWLQEGAAMYYETHLLPGLHEELPPVEGTLRAKYSYSDLKKLDLEKLPDQEATQYYLSCYQLFRFLVSEYGEEKIKSVFAALKKYPYLDLDSNRKKELLNARTEKAFQQVLKTQNLEREWNKKEK